MWKFVQEHAAAVVAALAFLFIGLLGGYYLKPDPAPQIQYKDRVVEKVVEKRVEVAAKAETRVVYLDRVIKPDGTRIEHEVDKTESKTTIKDVTDKVDARDEKSELAVAPAALPAWRAGVLVGTDLTLTPVYGGLAERRIVGPFSAGVWALSKGPTVGVALTMEW